MIGEKVVLRYRMSAGDAHYAGELVEGAHIVTAWGCLLYTSRCV